jgi:CheY-like chemotaxis protein
MHQILAIDDKPESVKSLESSDVRVEVADPHDDKFDEVIEGVIKKSDLILIDEQLNAGSGVWLKATEGASFVGHFRSRARKDQTVLPPIVLITAHEEAYASEIPAVGQQLPLQGSFLNREHRLAPALDLEWV